MTPSEYENNSIMLRENFTTSDEVVFKTVLYTACVVLVKLEGRLTGTSTWVDETPLASDGIWTVTNSDGIESTGDYINHYRFSLLPSIDCQLAHITYDWASGYDAVRFIFASSLNCGGGE
jgi:hypothetical protein